MRLNSKNRKPRSRKAFACLCLAGGLLFLGMVFGLSRYSDMQSCEHRMNELIEKGDIPTARAIQYKADRIIYKMCEAHGDLYAVQKEILRRMYGLELGGVREPMPGLIPSDEPIIAEAQAMIEAAIAKL